MTLEFGITVGIPAYNARKSLEIALDSVLSQTFEGRYEILIVDDGSEDTTANIGRAYELMLPEKVRLIRTPNRGVAAARNTIVQEARFNHLTWLDADDFYMPGKLERQYDALMLWHTVNHTLPGDPYLMVFSNYLMDGKVCRFGRYLGNPERAILAGEFRAYLWASMTATEAYRSIAPFNEVLHRSEDTDWLLRYLKQSKRQLVVTDGEPLVQYHFSTNRDARAVEASFKFMLEHYGDRMKAHGIYDEFVPRRWWEISNFYLSKELFDDMWRCRALAAHFDEPRYGEKLEDELAKLAPEEGKRVRAMCMAAQEMSAIQSTS